jgi:signal transduction histidine kinase
MPLKKTLLAVHAIRIALLAWFVIYPSIGFARVNIDSLYKCASVFVNPKQVDSFLEAYCLQNNAIEAADIAQLFDFTIGKYKASKADIQTLSVTHIKYIHLLIDKGFLKEAEAMCNQSLKLLPNEACGNANLLLALSKIYSYKGDFKTAVDYAYKALAAADKKTGCVKEIHNAYRYLSIHFAELRDSAKSHEFAVKTYEVVKDTKDTNLIASGIISVMDDCVHARDYAKADSFIRVYQRIAQGVTDEYHNATMYNLAGTVLVGQDRIAEGISMYQRSLEANQKMNDEISVMYLHCNIGRAQRIASQFEASLESYQKGFALATKLNAAMDKLIALDGIAYAYRFMGKTEQALEMREWAFNFMKDTLKEESLAEATRELDAKYQLSEKANKILLLEKDNSLKQRNIQLRNVLILLGLLSLGFAYILYRRMKLKKDLDKQKSLEQERHRIAAELHDDLGSNITAIKMLSDLAQLKNKDPQNSNELDKISKNASQMISNMSDIIWAMNTNNDSISGLMQYIKLYATEYLNEHEIDLEFTWNPSQESLHMLGDKRRHILLIVKEILHNAVKHADATKLIIEGSIVENKLEMLIKDNGKGFLQEDVKRFSNGIANMQDRALKLGGAIQMSGDAGTSTKLTVPL